MKNVVLIGGSYGIGRAIAEQQVAAGNQVWIASRTMENHPSGVTHITFDASSHAAFPDEFPEEIDSLIYCPGSINLRPFTSLKEEAFRQDMEINFFSMVKCVKALIPKLKKSTSASIILFSTVAVQTGLPFHTSISAAKGAIEGFAKALAAELAPKMRVNVIAPSLTDTPLAGKLLSSEKSRDSSAARHPLKRVGRPEDMASMASFLISESSSWMTGQVLHVDGGMSTLRV